MVGNAKRSTGKQRIEILVPLKPEPKGKVILFFPERRNTTVKEYELGMDTLKEYFHKNVRLCPIWRDIEFDYDEETNHGESPVEYRPMLELENHAKYDGEW